METYLPHHNNPLKNKLVLKNIKRIIPKTPIIFQTKNTPIVNTLADPFKKTIFYGFIIVLFYGILIVNTIIDFKIIYNLLIIIFVIYIYISQYNNNQKIIQHYHYLPYNSNLYQYKKINNETDILDIIVFTVLLFIIIQSISIHFIKTISN